MIYYNEVHFHNTRFISLFRTHTVHTRYIQGCSVGVRTRYHLIGEVNARACGLCILVARAAAPIFCWSPRCLSPNICLRGSPSRRGRSSRVAHGLVWDTEPREKNGSTISPTPWLLEIIYSRFSAVHRAYIAPFLVTLWCADQVFFLSKLTGM